MSEIFLRYLNHDDVAALAMSDQEILAAVEGGSWRRVVARRRSSPACTWSRKRCIPAAPRAATRFLLGRPEISGSRSWSPRIGNRACGGWTSSSRRPAWNDPRPTLKTAWITKGACVIPYGTMSAVELTLTDIMDKIVMDDWGRAKAGPFGALRAHVDSGRLSESNLHAELGQIVAGVKPGRQSSEETNLFWHRGLSLSDIALGAGMLKKAEQEARAHGHRAKAPLPMSQRGDRQCTHVFGNTRGVAGMEGNTRLVGPGCRPFLVELRPRRAGTAREALGPIGPRLRIHVRPSVIAARAPPDARRQIGVDGVRRTFLPDGEPLTEGALLRQPRLTQALEHVASGGVETIRGGALVSDICNATNQAGGNLSANDFRALDAPITAAAPATFEAADGLDGDAASARGHQ